MSAFDLGTWDEVLMTLIGRSRINARRSPFQGEHCRRFPGLMPWAMIFNRFAVSADRQRQTAN
jgi:hypothetical protein